MSGYNFSPDSQAPQRLKRHYLIFLWLFIGLLGLHNWQLHQSLYSQQQYLHQLPRVLKQQHHLNHHAIDWAKCLKAIARALPEQMYLEQLDFKKSLLRLQGKTLNAKWLKSYQRSLRHLNWVKHVRLEQLKAPMGSSSQSFVLTLSFN
ncbi:PilN domain-containing protein [Celerinatantimonas diazotrophica]|uniref:Fimbrial assembly protein PilN n=1 Tax=Celerinatantimonas diazotrophica TaxID=412034 RepID=A0A4R1K1M8_9GAMM|nr:PilN domain-containing protein [Celerinatantimonas diazotrophica]TCK57697.1 fimbrial assembly protein PilN [Celerinatantimonas diazotrophica]CAG9298241.1 hypothetical protein CEDIAZO_03436 [Celerinatantimonas diazotrophica]